ncbi:hypothetical protein BC829DRAFT_494788 [Chytridium lagenaria]|nr:hypothetical protein BC829DRAFT_494788 [Chytridium lagenaria]
MSSSSSSLLFNTIVIALASSSSIHHVRADDNENSNDSSDQPPLSPYGALRITDDKLEPLSPFASCIVDTVNIPREAVSVFMYLAPSDPNRFIYPLVDPFQKSSQPNTGFAYISIPRAPTDVTYTSTAVSSSQTSPSPSCQQHLLPTLQPFFALIHSPTFVPIDIVLIAVFVPLGLLAFCIVLAVWRSRRRAKRNVKGKAWTDGPRSFEKWSFWRRFGLGEMLRIKWMMWVFDDGEGIIDAAIDEKDESGRTGDLTDPEDTSVLKTQSSTETLSTSTPSSPTLTPTLKPRHSKPLKTASSSPSTLFDDPKNDGSATTTDIRDDNGNLVGTVVIAGGIPPDRFRGGHPLGRHPPSHPTRPTLSPSPSPLTNPMRLIRVGAWSEITPGTVYTLTKAKGGAKAAAVLRTLPGAAQHSHVTPITETHPVTVTEPESRDVAFPCDGHHPAFVEVPSWGAGMMMRTTPRPSVTPASFSTIVEELETFKDGMGGEGVVAPVPVKPVPLAVFDMERRRVETGSGEEEGREGEGVVENLVAVTEEYVLFVGRRGGNGK